MFQTRVAAIYIRVSTDEQTKGPSLEAQESILREYAKLNGYDVYNTYCDGGYSGKNFDRPELQRMFKDISADKVDVILVWKIDRLSRNTTDVENLIDSFLTPKNKKLVVTSINFDSGNTTGRMFISILTSLARFERGQIIERVNSGMQKRAEKGQWNGGIVFGYDSKNKELIINDIESRIVREIFKLRADGKGYKYIVNILNSKGVKTKKGVHLVPLPLN